MDLAFSPTFGSLIGLIVALVWALTVEEPRA